MGRVMRGDVLNVRPMSVELLRRARVQAAHDGVLIREFVAIALARYVAEREKARTGK